MVMIGSDSQAMVWATRNTKGVPGHHLVDKLHEQIRQLQCRHRGLAIELRWTRGHEGLQKMNTQTPKPKSGAGRLQPDNAYLNCAGETFLLADRQHSRPT